MATITETETLLSLDDVERANAVLDFQDALEAAAMKK
jgi:hypothetical protein